MYVDEILNRIAPLIADNPVDAALGATCSMAVPGTELCVPIAVGCGPVSTWRIARDGYDSGVTVAELEAAMSCGGRFVAQLSWCVGTSDVSAIAWADSAVAAVAALGRALEHSWPAPGSRDSLSMDAPIDSAPLPSAIVRWQLPEPEFSCELRIDAADGWLAELAAILGRAPDGVAERLVREHDQAGRPEFYEWITEVAGGLGTATVHHGGLCFREF